LNKHHRSVVAAAILVVVAMLGAACGGGGSGTAGATELSGSVTVSGSSTVEPISAAVAEQFSGVNPNVQLSVDGPGTGDGFALFCDGETDISDASRPITEEEIAVCEENNIDFVELKVAIDGISVITSHDNQDVDCLSFPDLYALLGPESESFEDWSDANQLGAQAGGSGDYPDAPLEITAPGEESGTYDSFAEIVLEGVAVDERGRSEDGPFVRPDYQASGDDNVIVQGVAENENSLGWVGFAFYENNSDTVRAIPIEAEEGTGCVEPTADTIRSGEYPIARDLFIYVNKAAAEENEAVSAYVDYYLGEGWRLAEAVGYVSLDEESKSATTEVWESLATGTQVEV
jgi:phosphate transport system substrate-binding protein